MAVGKELSKHHLLPLLCEEVQFIRELSTDSSLVFLTALPHLGDISAIPWQGLISKVNYKAVSHGKA